MLKMGLINMGVGVAIAAVGVVATVVSYSLVSGGGGTYIVTMGAFIVGGWRFLVGLVQVLRGLSGEQAPTMQGAAASSLRTSDLRTRPATTALISAPPIAVQVVGVLLIVAGPCESRISDQSAFPRPIFLPRLSDVRHHVGCSARRACRRRRDRWRPSAAAVAGGARILLGVLARSASSFSSMASATSSMPRPLCRPIISPG